VGIFLEELDNILANRAARPGATMRITTLQWAVGMFCALVGAMMLIVPHQVETSVYATLYRHLSWWGVTFLVAGLSVVGVAVFAPPQALAVAAHLLAGLLLLGVAGGFASNGIWVRSAGYGILGVGTALVPFLPRAGERGSRAYGRDLLALLLGMSMLLTGLAIFLIPSQFNASIYNVIRIQLPWYGVAFTIIGLLLVYLQIRPEFPHTVGWAVYLSAGGALLMFMASTASQRTWTSIIYYGWFGVLLMLLPWLDPALQHLRPTSLRVRVALALVVAVAAPLIVAVTIVTDRTERVATSQALALQKTIAAALAADTSRFVTYHAASAAALAKAINLSQMGPAQQEALLRALGQEYPDVVAFATYDDRGRPIARGDSHPPEFIGKSPVFDTARRTNAQAMTLQVSPISGRLLFQFGAPLRRSDNSWAGLLVLSVDTARVVRALASTGAQAEGQAFLVDDLGRVLAHPHVDLNGSVQDLPGMPPVEALLSQPDRDGALLYPGPKGEQLAGYARVSGAAWSVVVERPLAVALAGTHAGRELAFAILLVMMIGAGTAGTFAASVLVRPLQALGRETKRLGEEGAAVALPDSGIAEVRDLTVTFGEMSARLSARTRERATAEEGLRRQNAYLSALHETALGLINRLDVADLLHAIVTRACHLVGTSDGLVYLVNHDTDELESKVATGTLSFKSRVKRGQGVSGRVWVSGEPLVINDYDTWSGRVPGSPLGVNHATAGIPLKSGDQVLGVMMVAYREPGRTFGPEELDMLGRFGQLAALALNNAWLHGAVQDREARIRSIMDSTSDGFVFVGRDGTIKSISRRVNELLPLGAAAAAGGDLAEALAEFDIPPDQLKAVVAVLRSLRQGGDPSGAGDLAVAGGARVLHWDAQPARDDGGNAVGLALTLQDVTQERAVSRMKSDFVSFVTHQLRTPLAGIKWMLELAAETQDGGEVQAYIQDAREANERLVNLVNDLLDISRLEGGRLVVSPQTLHLGEMTRNVLDELTPLITEKGHRFSVTGGEAIPPVVADPQLLRQVVMNLVSNAIKYTPAPGQIALQMRAENGVVRWAIQDNGIGIPKDALPRLFEKFFRADNVHKIETEGTGLGLYLVRLIVERCGGRIWCESEEGKGSTFLFTVPLSGGQER
jgi:PAS domain S-box-containing protein